MKEGSRRDMPLVIREYILQSHESLESFVLRYPTLIFESIGRNIFYVRVPIGSEDAFVRLQGEVSFIAPPTLYGLNAVEALLESNILMFHEYPFGELRGNGVIIGFVDTGIDYLHTVFKNADNTTRIIRIWDQTIPGNPPVGYTYGSEYTQEQINIALRAENPYEVVPSRDEVGHGTFLAGVAAGDDKTGAGTYRGGAPDALIVMVKLKPAQPFLKNYYFVPETAIAYQDNDFIAGVSYLVDIALQFKKPLVICVAVGNNDEAHDGNSVVERYLNLFSLIQNIIIITAAGNEANSGHHFFNTITTGERQDVEINVAEGENGFFLNIWVNPSDLLAVGMRSPIGQVIQKIPIFPNSWQSYEFSIERTVVTVIYNYPDVATGAENIIIRFENPTPGLWNINIFGEAIIEGNYNMWLPRVGFILEGTRFLRSNIQVTIVNPATGDNVITVGTYDFIDQSVYIASGRGPNAIAEIKPDFIAPGVNVEGPRVGGGFTSFVGTSTAVAIASAAAALLMQWSVVEGNLKEMNTRVAMGIFVRGTTKRRGVIYPNFAEGYGRLDMRSSITNI